MTSTNADSLYKEILSKPQEDTLRLVFADALDERGGEGDCEWAEYIRTQDKLEKIGPPRAEYKTVLKQHGPGYYSMIAESLYEDLQGEWREFRVGDRIDIIHAPYIEGRAGKEYKRSGLVVSRVEVEDPSLETHKIVLRQDELSTPYPKAEAKKLVDRLAVLWETVKRMLPDRHHFVDHHATMRYWFPVYAAAPGWVQRLGKFDYGLLAKGRGISSEQRDSLEAPLLSLRLGLPSEVDASWQGWCVSGAALCRQFPICKVRIRGTPEWQWQQNPETKSWLFTWAGRWPDIKVRPTLLLQDSTYHQLGLGLSTPITHEAHLEILSRFWPRVPADGWSWEDG